MESRVEEKGDKAQRRGMGDHAYTAVSVLQRETDMRKRRWTIKEGEENDELVGICQSVVALWDPGAGIVTLTLPLTFYSSSIKDSSVTPQLTLIYIAHT